MSYECRVERDSIRHDGRNRATTFVIRFPRRVLAETVTHRVNSDTWGNYEEVSWCERAADTSVSKNSASSRAIPFQKMVESVLADPFTPSWTKAAKGMQGAGVSEPETILKGNAVWAQFRGYAVQCAEELFKLGFHKQDCNRCLEPFAWITQVVTSSRWDNFFALRCHEMAEPHFRHIARMMYLARLKSTPITLMPGQWHLPFTDPADSLCWVPDVRERAQGVEPGKMPDLIRKSAARCAWVSYENHDREASDEAHFRTFDRLLAEVPRHGSPIEHQLTPMPEQWGGRLVSNTTGWLQARKLVPQEEVRECVFSAEEIKSWGME